MREFSFTACECGALFPKSYDRMPTCPKCGTDVELPGVDTHTGEFFSDCWPLRSYAPEVM